MVNCSLTRPTALCAATDTHSGGSAGPVTLGFEAVMVTSCFAWYSAPSRPFWGRRACAWPSCLATCRPPSCPLLQLPVPLVGSLSVDLSMFCCKSDHMVSRSIDQLLHPPPNSRVCADQSARTKKCKSVNVKQTVLSTNMLLLIVLQFTLFLTLHQY